MKFWQWCAQDLRRLPHGSTLAPDQPHHLWFGSNWQDSAGDRWVVRWAPVTGELYALNAGWDVQPVGRIPGTDEFHQAYEGVKVLQSVPDSLRLLSQVIDESLEVWEPPDPSPVDEGGIDL